MAASSLAQTSLTEPLQCEFTQRILDIIFFPVITHPSFFYLIYAVLQHLGRALIHSLSQPIYPLALFLNVFPLLGLCRLVAPLQRPRGERRLKGHSHLIRGLPTLLSEGRRRGEQAT